MDRTLVKDLAGCKDKTVTVYGWLHKKRLLGGLTFINLRDRSGIVQIVINNKEQVEKLRGMQTGSVLKVTGKITVEPRAPGGYEIHEPILEVLVPVTSEPLIEIDKPLSHAPANLDTLFELRSIGLRNTQEAAIFKVQSAILQALREYFYQHDFTEIRTPKILAAATEGGAEVFKFDYFGKQATLAQSPQFYKQIMVGVFERVFEISPVYRAEPSATTRHMSEYTSVDAEMGFINIKDLENVLSELMHFVVDFVFSKCRPELELLKAEKPKLPATIPSMSMAEIHKGYSSSSGQNAETEKDLRPDEEKWACEYAKEHFDSEAVFVTDWPASEMKFYHKTQDNNPDLADRIDLLFRGVEIVTGSLRENDYQKILGQLKEKVNGDPNDPGFKPLLMAMQAGMPAHGGFGLGLERLTEKLLGLHNVKEATLFPRDINRLSP
jgi:nondiscriminating aspartyl-tRNA synthetase